MTSYRASDRVLFTPLVDGDGVLLDLDTKFYFTLNRAGTAVWKQLSLGAQTVDALVESVVESFDVDPDTARSDVEALLAELRAESLLG